MYEVCTNSTDYPFKKFIQTETVLITPSEKCTQMPNSTLQKVCPYSTDVLQKMYTKSTDSPSKKCTKVRLLRPLEGRSNVM